MMSIFQLYPYALQGVIKYMRNLAMGAYTRAAKKTYIPPLYFVQSSPPCKPFFYSSRLISRKGDVDGG